MSGANTEWYKKFSGLDPLEELVRSGKNTVALNRKITEKSVDTQWLDAVEEGLLHLDKVLRNPRSTIEDAEEIVPIALSKKITVESIKHLAQHTNYIQSVDEKTGRITPSKILNVYKEESMMTYENKFVNTLIDRLFIFVNRRYDKLKEIDRNQERYSLDFNSQSASDNGDEYSISIRIEAAKNLNKPQQSGFSSWERVEKIKKAVDSYKGSKFCAAMGNAFIRPPVMRTNAIMKNVELKACLVLWQFIESYDKAGYDIYVSDEAQKPAQEYIDDLCRTAAMDYMLLGYHTSLGSEVSGRRVKSYTPKVLRRFVGERAFDHDISVDEEMPEQNGFRLVRRTPDNAREMINEIDKIIRIEKQYIQDEENKIIKEKRAAEEAERLRQEEERRRAEEARIAAEIRREQERKAEEKRIQEENERKLREALEQKRREEEERQREEEEDRRRKERERIERERREEEERIRKEAEERARIESAVRTQEAMRQAETEEVKIPKESAEEKRRRQEEETAARIAREQANAARAARLREERRLIEQIPFEAIYAEYAKTPYHIARRGIRKLLKSWGFQLARTQLTDDDKALMEIEQRLEGYRLAAEKAERERIAAERAEKRRVDDIFDKYSASSFRQFRLRMRQRFDRFKKR